MARHNLGKKIDANGTLNDLGNTVSDDDLTKISSIPYKLDKTTYEFNKELAIGSTGKVLVGKFPMYDSNVTISVSSTTNTTFYGTLVIATQNINDSHGGTYVANVYNDPTGTLSSSFVVKYPTNSRIFEVYCNFPSWSKNLIHIQAVALKAEPTNIVELITTDIPTDSLVTVNNVIDSTLSSKYLSFDGGTLNYQGQIKAGTSVFKDLYVEAENLRVLNPKNEDTTPTKIATIDSTGYIKYRTPSEIKSDMGVEIGAAGKLGVDTAIGDSPTNAKLPTSLAVANYLESKGLVTPSDLENTYMKKSNPNGTGSLSLNRKANSTSGVNSTTVGYDNTASGRYSMAQGQENTASGWASHAEGSSTTASGYYAHAEGVHTIARGECSHAEGEYTTATHQSQHVFGEYNVLDTATTTQNERGTYIEIVGNGESEDGRSNARTLDWDGNEVLSGNITAAGFKTPSGTSTQVLRADGGVTTFGSAASHSSTSQVTNDTYSTSLPTNGAIITYLSSNYLSRNGGTLNASKTLTMGGTSNSTGAKIQWGTVSSNTPYIGFASDQSDGTFMVGSLKGTNYQSGLAIGGGSGNLLWKGVKVATTSDIPTKTSQITNDSGFITSSSLPSGLVESEDYSQSSEVTNNLNNYVTKNELLNLTHPINSIYISINSTSPSQLFGGTWVELPAGTALWTTATASGDAGGTIAAGLPNITGTWTTSWNQANRGFHSLTTSGAFYDSYSAGLHDGAGRIQGTDENNSGTRGFPWFDASRSNSIYGNSKTVQPPAYKIYAWRRTA